MSPAFPFFNLKEGLQSIRLNNSLNKIKHWFGAALQEQEFSPYNLVKNTVLFTTDCQQSCFAFSISLVWSKCHMPFFLLLVQTFPSELQVSYFLFIFSSRGMPSFKNLPV
jgi:hypothetical protein